MTRIPDDLTAPKRDSTYTLFLEAVVIESPVIR